MKQLEIPRFAEDLGVLLSQEQVSALEAFTALLAGQGVQLGLIAAGDAQRIRERHVLDCLRSVLEVAGSPTALDLGSGAGLPGLVVAIAVPDTRVTLVERRQRRAAFLEMAIRDLGVTNASVVAESTEEIRLRAQVCLARAFAPIEESWRSASGLLESGGRLVYFGGKSFTAVPELPGARGSRLSPCPLLESAGPLVIITSE
ncbi:MAG: RsmG family class I SAM-dependent methyltransferase [Actinomycetota bacterium]